MHLDEEGLRMSTTLHNQAVGAYGERVAERYLIGEGLAILERNWRCSEGELDLVAREGSTLVACEVKTRSSNAYGSPHEAVGPEKLDRLQRLVVRWATERLGATPPDIRVDLVAVMASGRGPASVEHVRGLL